MLRSMPFRSSSHRSTSATPQWRNSFAALATRRICSPERRLYSVRPEIKPTHVSLLLASSPSSESIKLPHIWLRDSCPCNSCVHPSTKQKLHRTSDVPLDIAPTRVKWVKGEDEEGLVLEVHWNRPIYRHDTGSGGIEGHQHGPAEKGPHVSRYPESFLHLHSSPRALDAYHHSSASEAMPWLASQLTQQPSLFVKYSDLSASPSKLLDSLTQLTRYGIVILRGVPTIPPEKGDWELRKVANLFSHVRNTFYGDLWDVKSLPKAHSRNIAYTDLDLDLHMDLLYFESPPRYQLLHCLRNRHVMGGQSLFVDALQASHTLYAEDRTAFNVLCETDVGFWYVNDGHHLEHKHKTIVTSSGPTSTRPKITAINYSPPFQSPLPLHSTPPALYPSLQKFAALLRRPEARWEHLLEEGDVAVFDNRRVLHARRAFTEHPMRNEKEGESNRWLKGCYVEADAVLDKVRVLRTELGMKDGGSYGTME